MIQTNRGQPAIAIIQARCSSTRLPLKVLKPLAGKPMIWHIVERARSCRLVDHVIVATSSETSDDPLAEFCVASGIPCHRGSLTNVLSRYLEVLELYPYDYVVRITGDCPLIHPPFIDRQIELLVEHDADMVWLNQKSTLLEGQGVHSSQSLRAVAEQTNHPADLEHVGSRFFSKYPNFFRCVGLEIPSIFTGKSWRITVDERADYDLMASLYDELYEDSPIDLHEVVAYLKANPIIAQQNSQVSHSAINKEISASRERIKAPLFTLAEW